MSVSSPLRTLRFQVPYGKSDGVLNGSLCFVIAGLSHGKGIAKEHAIGGTRPMKLWSYRSRERSLLTVALKDTSADQT